MSVHSSRGAKWNRTREQILRMYDYTCVNCGYDGHEEHSKMHVDHVIPKAKGGTDDLDNLVLLCGITGNRCNTRKGANLVRPDTTWFDRTVFAQPVIP